MITAVIILPCSGFEPQSVYQRYIHRALQTERAITRPSRSGKALMTSVCFGYSLNNPQFLPGPLKSILWKTQSDPISGKSLSPVLSSVAFLLTVTHSKNIREGWSSRDPATAARESLGNYVKAPRSCFI